MSRRTETALLDEVQRRTLGYFTEFAHPASGLARERSNRAFGYGGEVVTASGTGFGAMAMIAGVERGWIGREDAAARVLRIVRFLGAAERHHGVLPHFMNGETGRTIPFMPRDDGGDIVETAFLMAGLLTARQYFDRAEEAELRERVDGLWRAVEWDWHLRPGTDVLTWHWSPSQGWAIGQEVRGWNECLIAYVLAAGAPEHKIGAEAYHRGWAGGAQFRNGRPYHGITLPLGPEGGGPLFFAHYSFLGLDPRGLVDRYADFWEQNVRHTAINRDHCIRNPHGHAGYGPDCWGLTASDDDTGYVAHAPDRDTGVISPTAALSSFPYAPEHGMAALRTFDGRLGDRLWGPYGFRDAFCEARGWVASSHLAIDQGPIVVMIENHRSGLLWRLFMSCPEVAAGLERLGFSSPHLAQAMA